MYCTCHEAEMRRRVPVRTLFLKQKRGKWLAPGNMSWAMLGIPVNVFSTTMAIILGAGQGVGQVTTGLGHTRPTARSLVLPPRCIHSCLINPLPTNDTYMYVHHGLSISLLIP